MRRQSMRLSVSELPHTSAINFDFTLNSGQVFLWNKHGRFWYGIDGSNVLKCDDAGLAESRLPDKTDFFRVNQDTHGMIESISRDKTVREAVARYPGLRLLRQEPFQCCVTFIASTNSNIQKIRSSLQRLCAMFGRNIRFDGMQFWLFPKPSRLAGANMDGCGLGYRARYVRESSGMVSNGMVDFKRIKKMDYYSAKEEVMAMPGVGNKVADCILLFSLDKYEAFPLDRWIVRMLQKHYPKIFDIGGPLTDRRYEAIHDRVVEHFGPYAGYAQQFLFKMQRDNHSKGW